MRLRVLIGLITILTSLSAQPGRDPRWQIVGVGPAAAQPATCYPNRDVYICVGAGCSVNGQYRYCTATNTFTNPFNITVGSIAWGNISGTLSNQTDLNTALNSKVPTSRTISTTAPLAGGGALSGNLTLSIPVATNSASGYLSAADHTTFAAKESALTFNSPLLRSTNTISCPTCTTSSAALTANGVLIGQGLQATAAISPGTDNQVLRGATGGAPAFGSLVKADLPGTTVYTDQSNTWSTGAQDFSAVTSFRVRVAAGLTAATNGFLGYDSTNNMLHGAQASGDAFIPQFTITPTNDDCVKWVVSGSNYKLGSAGAACGSGGSGVTSIGGLTGVVGVASGIGVSGTDIVFDPAILAGTYPSLAGANPFTGTNSFAANGTTENLRLPPAAIPSTPNSGALFVGLTGLLHGFNGTNIETYVHVLGSGVTPAAEPTSANVAVWGANYSLADGGLPPILKVSSGTKALATSAVSSGTCTSAQTSTATGTATTDDIVATINADPTGVTGYAAATTGGLFIYVYPTTDTVNFKVCNNTSSSITPGAITLNWRVLR